MNLREYQLQAKRTCPSLGSFEQDILHMILGVNTEIGEVLDIFKKHIAYGKPIDKVNLEEELCGDIAWYMANQMNFEGYELDFDFTEISKDYSKLSERELYYKVLSFSHDYNSTDNHWHSLWQKIYDLSVALGVDFYKGLERNINKLKVRFPEKFTQENALNRDLESERKELEK